MGLLYRLAGHFCSSLERLTLSALRLWFYIVVLCQDELFVHLRGF